MSGFEAILLFVQLAVPLALIAWVGFPRKRSRAALALDAAVAGSYVVFIGLAGLWMALPAHLTWVYAALLVGAAFWNARRLPRDARSSGTLWVRVVLGVRAAALLGLVGLVVVALSGRRPFVAEAVDLEFPLCEGTYLVVSGGSNVLLNFHLGTLERERARPFRGQSYAVDLVKVGDWGSRSDGMFPDELSGFAVYGDSIHAPCPGLVVRAEDGHPDRRAPGEQPETLAGNHVILECDDIWIVLAHMQEGSVRVSYGDRVATGEVLGVVGNSGSSDEPHLHIHAQTPGASGAPLSGSPIPITFDGRCLVWNDRIHSRGSRAAALGLRAPERGRSLDPGRRKRGPGNRIRIRGNLPLPLPAAPGRLRGLGLACLQSGRRVRRTGRRPR